MAKLSAEYGEEVSAKMKVAVLYAMLPKDLQERVLDKCAVNWDGANVKGMYLAPHIHEHFTIHKWLRQTAYILTHNMNNLEHIANNDTDTTKHTDVYHAQF